MTLQADGRTDGWMDGWTDKAATICSPFKKHKKYNNSLHSAFCTLTKGSMVCMVNVLKFRKLYFKLVWTKFYFLCSCFLEFIVEWQTV